MTRNGPITIDGEGIVGIDPRTGTRRGTLVACPSSCGGGELIASDWSPDGSQVAFIWTCMAACPADDYGIYVGDPTTRDPHLVRPGMGYSEVAWSGDGTRLAFLQRGNLLTMDPGGSEVELVPAGAHTLAAFSWAPDGSFAFADLNDGGIYVMGPDAREPRRLIDTGADPAWSPDGKSIAYLTGCLVWEVPAAGRSRPTRLADLGPLPGPNRRPNCRSGFGSVGFSFEFGHPAWSPDGTELVVVGARGQLVEVPIDGSPPTVLRPTHRVESAPSWRPLP